MPKELTHWLLAEEAMLSLGGESHLAATLREHHELYLAGAVLPDTLLHLFQGPHASIALALADSFHDAVGDSHAPLLRVEEQFPQGIPMPILACLLGVISHMQADIAFHPFVYAVTGADGISGHYRLETRIDLYLMQAGRIPPVRHLADLVTPQGRKNLLEVCSLLFDPEGELPADALSQALELHIRYQAMYGNLFWQLAATLRGWLPVPRFRRQKQLFYPLNLFGNKYEIENEGRWCCPVSGEQRNVTLAGLADNAVQRTLELFRLVEQHGSLKTALKGNPGENLLTGLHSIRKYEIKPASGSKAAAL